MSPKLQDTAETIVKFIAKYPPLSLMGRAQETTKCVYCQAFGVILAFILVGLVLMAVCP